MHVVMDELHVQTENLLLPLELFLMTESEGEIKILMEYNLDWGFDKCGMKACVCISRK